MGQAEGQERRQLHRRLEVLLAGEARKRGVDGVVCGHIHHAVIRDIEGITYVNTGDFVESCTAIAEHHDGRLELIHWSLLESERASATVVALEAPAALEATAAE